MNDTLTDIEVQLRDSLSRWLHDHVDLSTHARMDGDAHLPAQPPVWRQLADDLGLLAASQPEAAGGLGGGLRTHLLILETLGEALACEPYLSTTLIAGHLLQSSGSSTALALLERASQGAALIGWAHAEPGSRGAPDDVVTTLQGSGAERRLHGRKALVQAGPWATQFLVSARAGDQANQPLVLCLIDANAPGLSRRNLRQLDGGWASELMLDGTPVGADAVLLQGDAAMDAIADALDQATLGVCAESLGLMRQLMAFTLAHLRERKQFGVPLASFQVLQHRVADMHILQEQANAITWAAAEALAAPECSASDRALAVSSAKVTVGRALQAIGQGAVQMHGAMGVTEELATGRFFRRATQIELMFGSSPWHLRRIDRLLGQVPAAV